MERVMKDPKIGDRVQIVRTLLYNGHFGTLQRNSGVWDDPWDYNVLLDDGQVIGVDAGQVLATP
jgi:hypothetical protein